VVRERSVCTHTIQAAVKACETEALDALRIAWQDGAVGGRAHAKETMLHIERLCRLPHPDLLRGCALNGGGR
jgi:hypothetical protein